MNKKKVLIGCFITLGVIIVLAIVGGTVFYRYFVSPIISEQLKMPEHLNSPGVIAGDGFLLKERFLKEVRLGTITDIVIGELDLSPGHEIGITGSKGALFVDENANVKSLVMFKKSADHVDIVDVDNDGVCEFINRGSWGTDASLIDHNGKTIWTYGGTTGVDDMCAGDINADGAMEFVVGFNGGGGVHMLDEHGNKMWEQPDGNVWHVELVDTDSDGILEIVNSNAGGYITVRNAQGQIISKTKPAKYFSSFSLCRWPGKNDREYALLSEGDKIWLFDFDGKTIAQLDAPKCGTLGHARGVPVKISSDQAEYFAVVVEFKHWERSILYVYNPDRALVYQEILPETCASIAAITLDNSAAETILLGGKEGVWQYKLSDIARVQ